MTCPNIYLGTGRFGARPLPAEYGNDAIILSSYDVTVNTLVYGQLRVLNHGTDDSPSTHVELFWSDPATNFAALPSRLIYEENVDGIAGATSGGVQGEYLRNWSYTFPTVGHFCLLARVENNSNPTGAGCVAQAYDSSSPPTDPQSAIHNINVVSASPMMFMRHKFMAFGFMAMNMQKDVQKTFLEVHVLDPAKDREKLLNLVGHPGIDRILAARRVKFALPAGLHLGEGRERILLRREHFAKDAPAHCVPRMRHLGQIDPEHLKHLLLPNTRLMEAKGKHEVDLLFGEARQTFIQVEAGGGEKAAYAVEVTHKAENGRVIGGLITIFVPPHDYF